MTVVKALQQSWIDELEIATQSIWPLLQRVRRHLHQHPELSLQEFETSRYIYALLKDHQLEPQFISSRNGVVCDYHFGTDSPVNIRVGLRGDIDALPIQTCSPATYASERPGVMHACGHDAHATMTLGATLLIKRMAEGGHLPWPVSIRSMFQPAEEVSRGGRMLIEEGFLSDLSHAFALHVDPSLMVGHIATRRGAITAGCASIAVHVVGQTGIAQDRILLAMRWRQACSLSIKLTFMFPGLTIVAMLRCFILVHFIRGQQITLLRMKRD